MPKQYPLMMRTIVKNIYNNNTFSIRYIAFMFKISKSTLHRWIHDKTITLPIICKRKNIDNLVIYNILSTNINSNPFIRLIDLQKIITSKIKHKLSLMTISRYLKKYKFTRKKVNKKLYNKELEKLKTQQAIFNNKIKDEHITENDVICIDESYFMSYDTSNYGWSKQGKRIDCFEQSNPIKYSLIMAISNKKVLAYSINKNNFNQYLFYEFLRDKLLPSIKNKYILLDNVSFHKTKLIATLFKDSSNKLLFIPPYSPQYNCIENAFSIVKAYYRTHCSKYINIVPTENIIKSIKKVTPIKLNNIYCNIFAQFK